MEDVVVLLTVVFNGSFFLSSSMVDDERLVRSGRPLFIRIQTSPTARIKRITATRPTTIKTTTVDTENSVVGSAGTTTGVVFSVVLFGKGEANGLLDGSVGKVTGGIGGTTNPLPINQLNFIRHSFNPFFKLEFTLTKINFL